MKKTLRHLALALVMILVISGAAPAAETDDPELAAEELAALGLLRGDGQGGLALDDPCDRLQGAVLFTRLLGQEEKALADPKPHPFRDIAAYHWAAPYVAYLYNQGLAYGVSLQEYGTGAMAPQQFATFCLRALGYTEGNELSDFHWSEALDFMVEKGIISGSLRNRLRATSVFRRGDAALLMQGTLHAQLATGGQTLLQQLLATGLFSGQQSAALAPADLRVAYPEGLLAEEVLATLSAQLGLKVGGRPYAPQPLAEEELYRQLREPEPGYDLCVLPGYVVEWLRDDGLLAKLDLRDFGGKDAFVPALRDNPYWYDEQSRAYYALPLALDLTLLYYDSSRLQNPDWSWLFRAGYSGGVYMPSEPTLLIPLALHYYGLPYDTYEDKQLLPAIQLLSGQAAAVPAYLDAHMLDIAEREGALLGVISSRELPELQRRQEQNAAYASWQALLPASGGPFSAYYAVIIKNERSENSTALLKELLQPAVAAANAQAGGYLPAVSGSGGLLSGAIGAAYPAARWERCRALHLNQQSRVFYQQTMRNVLLDQAKNSEQPLIASLEFTFWQEGRAYRSCRIDFTARQATAYRAGEGQTELLTTSTRKLGEGPAKTCQKELARLGVALWKGYYDGPDTGQEWSLTIGFADGQEKTCRGLGLPPTWPDAAMAILNLTGEDMLPPEL